MSKILFNLKSFNSARLILVLGLLWTVVSIASCGDGVPNAGRVVARVNGSEITYGELIRHIEKTRGPSVLLEMVDQVLIEQEATRRGLTLTPSEQEAGLNNAAARVGSMTDLKLQLESAGIPLETYQQKVNSKLLLDKIAMQEAKVSDDEIVAYYAAHMDEFNHGEMVKARMILLSDKPSAEAVREALDSPDADFAGLAKTLSEEGATAEKGGDMGWIEREDYAKEITDAAFALKPGQLSDVIQGPDGFVLLKLEDHRPAGVTSLQEVKAALSQRIQLEKLELVRSEWLQKARKNAELKVRDKELSEGVIAILDTVEAPPMPGEL